MGHAPDTTLQSHSQLRSMHGDSEPLQGYHWDSSASVLNLAADNGRQTTTV
jgi:hypothetical protein